MAVPAAPRTCLSQGHEAQPQQPSAITTTPPGHPGPGIPSPSAPLPSGTAGPAHLASPSSQPPTPESQPLWQGWSPCLPPAARCPSHRTTTLHMTLTNTTPPHTRQPHGHELQRQLRNGTCPRVGGMPGGTTQQCGGRRAGGSGAGVGQGWGLSPTAGAASPPR